jgi:hypothetical protein
MAVFTRVNGKKTKKMDLAYSNTRMEFFVKDPGHLMKDMKEESRTGFSLIQNEIRKTNQPNQRVVLQNAIP